MRWLAVSSQLGTRALSSSIRRLGVVQGRCSCEGQRVVALTPKPSDAPNLWIACRRIAKPLRSHLRTADGQPLDEYMLDA